MTSRTLPRTVTALTAASILVVLAACGPTVGRPSIRQVPNAPRVWDSADPAVLVTADGRTYLFGSTNNRRVPVRRVNDYQSSLEDSRVNWRDNASDAMGSRPAWVDPGEDEIWAPSVAKMDSTYVMYFAARNRYATTDENNDQCIGRAFSSDPGGGYVPERGPFYCGLPAEGATSGLPASNRFGRGALDPEIFRDTDGKWYLLVSLSRTTSNIGAIRILPDGRVSGGINAQPKILAKQSTTWHDGAEHSDRPFAFLENPSMVYEPRTKTYLLFYSAGAWWTDAYNTGFARCASPFGPCTLDTRAPFLRPGNGRTGVGGLTVFKANDGTTKVAYASWAAGHENQVGSTPPGEYKRQTHWADLVVSDTSDPANQTISLG